MFCTCRATVCSLMTSAAAISRLLRPAATSAQHLAARAPSARARRAGAARPASASTRARSGAAPSRANASRAASSSSPAVSSSPSARHARPTSTRARAASYGASSCRHASRRPPQRDERRVGVALGELDRAARVRGHRAQQVARPRAPAIAPSSSHAGARRRDVADRQHDLDVGRQQAGARRRARRSRRARGGSAAAAASAFPCASRSSASPGCGSQPAAACVPVGLLGGGGLAPQAVDLALPVVAPARPPRGSPPARSARAARRASSQRVRPRAVQLHDLGPVHEARPAEADHVGLLRAPPRQRRRPLVRAARLVRGLAADDHAAVHEAVDDRRQLARGDRHHRLVEQPQALADAPCLDQEDALLLARRARTGRRRRSARRSRPRRAPAAIAAVAVAGRRVLEHARAAAGSRARRSRAVALDEPPGAAEPARRAARARRAAARLMPIQNAQRAARSTSPVVQVRGDAPAPASRTYSSSRPSM